MPRIASARGVPLPRRQVLAGCAAALVAAGCRTRGAAEGDASEAARAAAERAARADEPPLRVHAARHGFTYGAAIDDHTLREDPALCAAFAGECGALVPEMALKWASLRPAADRFDFAAADRLVGFAEAHRLACRGHTLVWHEALPAWFPYVVGRGNAEAMLRQHVATVLGRYRGRMASWDVVNEPVDIGEPGALRRSPWLALLGADYIRIAFAAAAAADPGATLVLNENGLDYASPGEERKRQAVLLLLERLLEEGVPVHALGIQAHLRPGEGRIDAGRLAAFVAAVGRLGLKVIITELDLRDRRLPADIAARDAAVAEHAGSYLRAMLADPAVTGVFTWGLSDRASWLASGSYGRRRDGRPPRGLPLDRDLARKPLWQAIAAAFAAARPEHEPA